MKFNPSKPRPYARRGVVEPGRWEIDLRGVLDNGLVVKRERRVFPVNPSVGKIGKRQAATLAAEEWERWNRHGQVLRDGEEVPLPHTGGMKPGRAPTLAQFVPDYLTLCASTNVGNRGANRKTTMVSKRTVFRRHVLPVLGTAALDQIQQRDIDRYILKKSDEGRASNSIRLDLKYLLNALEIAVSHGLLDRVPKFRIPAEQESPVVALDEDEAARFVDEIGEQFKDERAVLIELYFRTGLRASEGVALYPADFDLSSAVPTVHVRRSFQLGEYGPTKNGKARFVPLVGGVAERVDALFAREGISPRSTSRHPFSPATRPTQPIDRKTVLGFVQEVGEAARVEYVTTHMLRHTFGTNCARRGVPPLTIKEWMGHRDLETTMRYVHLFAPDHLRWAKLLED